MLAPEYQTGFRILQEKIGLRAALSIAIPAFLKALMVKHKVKEGSDKDEATKPALAPDSACGAG